MNVSCDISGTTVLQACGLGKRYRLFASPTERLQALLGWADRSRAHWALKNVSFTLRRGQCLGVIGDNGAGKSTLLKLLAGTLQPSHGYLQRVGRVTAILELGAGFHPDFSGRDNLMFGGSLIGLGQADMQRLADEIIDFSELAEAIDRPVKTYSSGMVVRLAFALVTAVQPEVLIIDEALAVGDQHFQKKCIQRIEMFRENGCTVLFCSHSLYHIRQLCDHVLWLHQGQTQALGDAETVLAAYDSHVRKQMGDSSSAVAVPDATQEMVILQDNLEKRPGCVQIAQLPNAGQASLVSVEVLDLQSPGEGQPAKLQSPDLVVRLTAQMPDDECPSLAIMIEQAHGVGITTTGTHANQVRPRCLGNGLWQAQVTFKSLALHTGQYVISAYLFDERGLVVYDNWPNCVSFVHVFAETTPGLVRLPHEWS